MSRRAAEHRAQSILKELEEEISELKQRSATLNQLALSEDYVHFLKVWTKALLPSNTPCQSTHLYRLSLKVSLHLEKWMYLNIRPTCPVLMQMFPALSTTPQTKDWSGVSLVSDLTSGGILRTISHMMERLQEELCKLPDACESSRRRAQDTILTVISTPVHELPSDRPAILFG